MKLLKFVYIALFSSAYMLKDVKGIDAEDFIRQSHTWTQLLSKQYYLQEAMYEQLDSKSLDQVTLIRDLEFYNPNGLSSEDLLKDLKFNTVDQIMRRELIENSNAQVLDARRSFMADTKQQSIRHMTQLIQKKLEVSKLQAERLMHDFSYRNDYQNIMKQNSVIFHKILEVAINKHRETMSYEGTQQLMQVAQMLSLKDELISDNQKECSNQKQALSKEDREVKLIDAYAHVRDAFQTTCSSLIQAEIEQIRKFQMNHFHQFIANYVERFDLNDVDAMPDVKPLDVQKIYAQLTKEKASKLLDTYKQIIDKEQKEASSGNNESQIEKDQNTKSDVFIQH